MAKNDVLKQTLLHYIDLEYYANIMNEDFQYLLKQLEERCKEAITSLKSLNTKASYSAIMKVIKNEVTDFKSQLEHRLAEEAENVLAEELQFLDDTYNKSEKKKGLDLNLKGVATSALLFAPVVAGDSAVQFAERIGKNIYNAYDTSLRSGYLFGQNTDDIVSQTDVKFKKISQGMKNGIRTVVPSFARTTDRIVFLKNNVEVVWVTTLDDRVCITCASLSGLHFKSVSDAPTNPHPLCRCQLIPADKIEEPIPDFDEFVNELNEDEQRQVLGENRYNLWKEYHVQLKSFLNHGETMTLDEIREKYARLIENKDLVIPKEKFTEYALNPVKEPNKARVFKSALGYTLDNWQDLEENIRNHLDQKNMVFITEDEYGKRYHCDVEITGPNGNTKTVRTGWNLSPKNVMKMTTAFVR